jgi:hypothetical protein
VSSRRRNGQSQTPKPSLWRIEVHVPPLEPRVQGRGSGTAVMCLVVVTRGCHIGMALLTALPVSTGNARTLVISVRVREEVTSYKTYFLPASVAQQQQNRDAGQQTICKFCQHSTPCALLVLTHSHAHCDHKTNCGTNDFTMAGILVTGTD